MSLNSEIAVLGAILFKPEAYWQVADILTESDFVTKDSQELFKTFREMLNQSKPVDPWTVNAFNKNMRLDVLIELMSNSTGASNIRAYAEAVLKSAELRKLAIAGTRIAKCSGFAEAQTLLSEVRPQNAVKLSTMREAAKIMYTEVQKRYDNVKALNGVSTSISGLDELLGGIKGGQLIIVAARPGMGKSAFANQLAIGSERAYISTLEMNKTQLAERAAANIGNIPYRWLTHPKENEEVWPKLSAFMPKVIALNWVIDDSSGITADVICARIRQAHMAEPLTVAVIDHLGIISRIGKNDASELGFITTMFKSLAKDLNIPVLLLCQLNRGVEAKQDKRPSLSDLRDSGRIEEDADAVILMYRPEYYNLEPMGFVEFILAKNRDGATGSAWAASRLANMRLEPCQAPEYQAPSKSNVRGFGR